MKHASLSRFIPVAALVATAAGIAWTPSAAQVTSGAAPIPAPAAAGASAPADKGQALFEQVCSGCHDPLVVAGQAHDQPGWEDVVAQMVGKGAPATPEQASAIAAYLARTYRS